MINGAAVFPIEKWTAKYQGTAFAALGAVALSFLHPAGYIAFQKVIDKYSSHFALQIA